MRLKITALLASIAAFPGVGFGTDYTHETMHNSYYETAEAARAACTAERMSNENFDSYPCPWTGGWYYKNNSSACPVGGETWTVLEWSRDPVYSQEHGEMLVVREKYHYRFCDVQGYCPWNFVPDADTGECVVAPEPEPLDEDCLKVCTTRTPHGQNHDNREPTDLPNGFVWALQGNFPEGRGAKAVPVEGEPGCYEICGIDTTKPYRLSGNGFEPPWAEEGAPAGTQPGGKWNVEVQKSDGFEYTPHPEPNPIKAYSEFLYQPPDEDVIVEGPVEIGHTYPYADGSYDIGGASPATMIGAFGFQIDYAGVGGSPEANLFPLPKMLLAGMIWQ